MTDSDHLSIDLVLPNRLVLLHFLPLWWNDNMMLIILFSLWSPLADHLWWTLIYYPFIFFPSSGIDDLLHRCVLTIRRVRVILGSPFFAQRCYHSDSFRFVKVPWSMGPFVLALTNWLWSQNYKMCAAFPFTRGSIKVLWNRSQGFLSPGEINRGYSQQKFHRPAQCQMGQWSPISQVRRRYMEAAFYHPPNVWDHICYQFTDKIWEIHFRESEKYTSLVVFVFVFLSFLWFVFVFYRFTLVQTSKAGTGVSQL